MPKSMLEQYLSCDKPPPLDKLNPYREVIKQVLATANKKRNEGSILERPLSPPMCMQPRNTKY